MDVRHGTAKYCDDQLSRYVVVLRRCVICIFYNMRGIDDGVEANMHQQLASSEANHDLTYH